MDQLPTITITTEKLSALLGIQGQISDLWTGDYGSSITIEYAPTGSIQCQAIQDMEARR
jgi:hypothetical protein